MDNVSKAEIREIERHKYFMSQAAGCDVGMAAAREDWLANYASDFRTQRQARMLALQREEIARYKWIESEKARCDLGRQAALDWVLKYAARWREWYEFEFETVVE
ncbi:MAG: hypothetical protein HYV27_03230 [Candidatus Hydrogenedentes bacterium]|nr:hypothetical protein [Candidatus Hydrogenedentota bacterium]